MKRVLTCCASLGLMLANGICHAQGLPHVFEAGEPALASEVNANFAYLAPANVVRVGPAASGSATDSGAALQHAMQNIQFVSGSPSADNPYLVKLAPGVYDLETTPLQLRSFVLLEGSGRATTRITSSVTEMASGTLLGVDNAAVRNLTVENSHADGFAVAVYAGGAEMILEDVSLRAVGAANNRGLSTNNGRITLRRASIEASGGDHNYGVYNWIAPMEKLEDVSIRISSDASASNYGIWSSDARLELRRVHILIDGRSSSNYGVYSTTESTLFMADSSVYLDGLSGTTYHCLHFTASSFGGELVAVTTDVQHGGGDGKSGLFTLTQSKIEVHHSRFLSSDSIHAESGAQVKVGASQVSWFVNAGGSVRCVACYDASYGDETCQ